MNLPECENVDQSFIAFVYSMGTAWINQMDFFMDD